MENESLSTRINGRENRHANYIINKLSTQTINSMKKSNKLEDELLFDSPSTTAVLAEYNILIKSIEDTLKLLNSVSSYLKEKRNKEIVVTARNIELNNILSTTSTELSIHTSKIEAYKSELIKVTSLRENDVQRRKDYMKDMANEERLRVESSKIYLHLNHELQIRIREVARNNAIYVTLQKDLANDLDFYKSLIPKFNNARELRRIRMNEINAVLDQRLYFLNRKATNNNESRDIKVFSDKNMSSHIELADAMLFNIDDNDDPTIDDSSSHFNHMKSKISVLRDKLKYIGKTFVKSGKSLAKSRLILINSREEQAAINAAEYADQTEPKIEIPKSPVLNKPKSEIKKSFSTKTLPQVEVVQEVKEVPVEHSTYTSVSFKAPKKG